MSLRDLEFMQQILDETYRHIFDEDGVDIQFLKRRCAPKFSSRCASNTPGNVTRMKTPMAC